MQNIIIFNNIRFKRHKNRDDYERIDDVNLIHVIWNYYNPENKIRYGDGCDIHHINGNHLDNRIENLQKLTHGEHSSLKLLNNNPNVFKRTGKLKESSILKQRITRKFNKIMKKLRDQEIEIFEI